MRVCGIEFDDPRENPPRKRDCREWKEGARTTVREMWVTAYIHNGTEVSTASYPMTINNRGVCTFDGRPVKDEAERRAVAELFEHVKPV